MLDEPKDPELAPQALQVIHADSSNPTAKTARSLGIDGTGVTVAYIADGVDTNNPDFIRADGAARLRRLQGLHAATGTSAPTGGEEAFIDSSSIAAQGLQSYNISQLQRPARSASRATSGSKGVAPGASLVGLDRLRR